MGQVIDDRMIEFNKSEKQDITQAKYHLGQEIST